MKSHGLAILLFCLPVLATIKSELSELAFAPEARHKALIEQIARSPELDALPFLGLKNRTLVSIIDKVFTNSGELDRNLAKALLAAAFVQNSKGPEVQDALDEYLTVFGLIPRDTITAATKILGLGDANSYWLNRFNDVKPMLAQHNFDWINGWLSSTLFHSNIVKRNEFFASNPELLSPLYQTDIAQFSQMFFGHGQASVDSPTETLAGEEPRATICNQDDYMTWYPRMCTKGKALRHNSDPIGYNVHLPRGKVKAIFTEVYGGFKVDDASKMFKPDHLGKIDRHLLANGVAVVTLNLIDFKRLNVFQGEMPEDLHARLHASINAYAKALHSGTIDPMLEPLEGLPNFLYGASFGGRTAVKHAELYPDNGFAGYISHDGGVSLAMKDLPIVKPKSGASRVEISARTWLDPINEIAKIRKPVLLMQNYDDNNVTIAMALDFYLKSQQILKPLGREKLIQLLVTSQGNPIPDDPKEIHNKGHFLPKDPAALSRMASHILNFITRGPSAIPALSDHAAKSYRLYAFGQHLDAPVMELFLADAYKYYRKHDGTVPITDEQWESIYRPILNATQWFTLVRKDENTKKEIDRLIENNLLTDEVAKNAVAAHADRFAQFVVEKYHLSTSANDLAQSYAHDRAVHTQFLNMIKAIPYIDSPESLKLFLLKELYLANPSLAENVTDEMSDDARTLFNSHLLELHKITNITWEQASIAAIGKARREKLQQLTAEAYKENLLRFTNTVDELASSNTPLAYERTAALELASRIDSIASHDAKRKFYFELQFVSPEKRVAIRQRLEQWQILEKMITLVDAYDRILLYGRHTLDKNDIDRSLRNLKSRVELMRCPPPDLRCEFLKIDLAIFDGLIKGDEGKIRDAAFLLKAVQPSKGVEEFLNEHLAPLQSRISKANIRLSDYAIEQLPTTIGEAYREAEQKIETYQANLDEAVKSGDKNRVLAILNGNPGPYQTRSARTLWLFDPIVNRRDRGTPLHLAAELGHKDIVEILLERFPLWLGVEFLYADALGGSTPLHLAAQKGYLPVVQLLVEKEPELLNRKLAGGTTALHLAISSKDDATARYLLAQSIEQGLNHYSYFRNGQGDSLLHLAIYYIRPELVKLLLTIPGLLEPEFLRDKYKRTPLHLAAQAGSLTMVEMLLEKSPEMASLKDIWGNLPFDLASNSRIKELLRNSISDLAH